MPLQLLLADGEGVKVLIHITAGRRRKSQRGGKAGPGGKTSGDSCADVWMTDVCGSPLFFLLTMRKSIGNQLSLGFCFRSAAWLQSSFSALLVQFGSGFQVNFAAIRWLGEKKKPTLIVFRFYWSVVKHFSEQFSLNQIQGSFSALLVQFGSSFWVNFDSL